VEREREERTVRENFLGGVAGSSGRRRHVDDDDVATVVGEGTAVGDVFSPRSEAPSILEHDEGLGKRFWEHDEGLEEISRIVKEA